MIVELNTGTVSKDKDVVALALKRADSTIGESVEYISKEDALKEMHDEMSEEVMLDGMENPFSDMFRFSMKADYFNEEGIDALKKQIESLPAVREMHHPAGMYDPVFTLLRRAQVIGVAVIIVFVLLCAILIHHIMRLNVLAQRKQIRTMQLVGGHPSFIRKPYLIHALQMAVMSWAIAGIICLAVLLFISGLAQSELSPLHMTVGSVILLVLALGVCISSTWVAVTRVLG